MMPLLAGLALAGPPDAAPVNTVLDTLHRSATAADEATYFAQFSERAVFVGTDASERWTMSEFRAFAAPHFVEAPAWAYTPVAREVHFDKTGHTAWFYETVRHERYGDVRGSGVLSKQRGTWKIEQYVLSFPIPNAVAGDVLKVVADGPTTSAD